MEMLVLVKFKYMVSKWVLIHLGTCVNCMHILTPHPRHPESAILGMGLSMLCF